jgi:hypothetical protein
MINADVSKDTAMKSTVNLAYSLTLNSVAVSLSIVHLNLALVDTVGARGMEHVNVI